MALYRFRFRRATAGIPGNCQNSAQDAPCWWAPEVKKSRPVCIHSEPRSPAPLLHETLDFTLQLIEQAMTPWVAAFASAPWTSDFAMPAMPRASFRKPTELAPWVKPAVGADRATKADISKNRWTLVGQARSRESELESAE